MGSGSQHAPASTPVHYSERRQALGGKVLGNDAENDKHGLLLTCMAVYAIDLGVARPFKRSVVATSCHLAVISPDVFSKSLEAEDGEVKMCWYAWNSPTVIHGSTPSVENAIDLHAEEGGPSESPHQGFQDSHSLHHRGIVKKNSSWSHNPQQSPSTLYVL